MFFRINYHRGCLGTTNDHKNTSDGLRPKKVLLNFIVILFLITSVPPVFSAANTQAKNTLIMGVFPHFPPRTLEKIYAPIAAEMSTHLGKTVKLRTSTSFEKFSEKLEMQEFDIVFLQPFDYIHMADKYGYIPLAVRDEPLSAILVVSENSKYKKIEDLLGQTIALPPETAAISLLLKAHLKSLGIIPGKDIFFSHHRSHSSCLQQVLIGTVAACGTAESGRRFFMNKMSVKLDVIMETTAIPHTLFAINPRVSKEDRESILKTILALGKSKAGVEMLRRGKLKPFVTIDDKAYDVVREFAKKNME